MWFLGELKVIVEAVEFVAIEILGKGNWNFGFSS